MPVNRQKKLLVHRRQWFGFMLCAGLLMAVIAMDTRVPVWAGGPSVSSARQHFPRDPPHATPPEGPFRRYNDQDLIFLKDASHFGQFAITAAELGRIQENEEEVRQWAEQWHEAQSRINKGIEQAIPTALMQPVSEPTQEQQRTLRKLKDAHDADFRKAFLESAIHSLEHQRRVIIEDELKDGRHPRVLQLARQMKATYGQLIEQARSIRRSGKE